MLKVSRTVYCGQVNEEHLNKEIYLSGWVNKRRDLGQLIFIDLRDRSGIMQIIFDPQVNEKATKEAHTLRPEYVINVKGTVINRKDINEKLKTGHFELKVEEVEILSKSQTPPFHIKDEATVDEELRLKYRYLDLRRPKMHNLIKLRHDTIFAIRQHLNNLDFYEIETPLLSKSTPEGARDFLVPSRLHPGKFYALPQSPQQYKQLLMAAGMEKYFQIARCFRDEDLRANRQLEFTQLDVEMAFTNEEEIQSLCESLFKNLWKKILNIDIKTPFAKLTYKQAFSSYGTDKPDLRFEMQIKDVTSTFETTELKLLKDVINAGGKIGAIQIKNQKFSRAQIDSWTKNATDKSASGLLVLKFKEDKTIDSNVAKFLPTDFFNQLATIFKDLTPNDVLFIIAGDYEKSWDILGRLRLELGQELNLINQDEFNFVWITDFPLLEWNEQDKRFYAKHHPFTSPQDNWGKLEPAQIKARAYDIVCNGEEIGGGSIRIHDTQTQLKIFDLLGICEKDAKEKFAALLEALKFGFPPHGGIALGLDRIIMSLGKTNSIADVIAFPKTTSGKCLMMDTPSQVEEKQLEELHVKVAATKK